MDINFNINVRIGLSPELENMIYGALALLGKAGMPAAQQQPQPERQAEDPAGEAGKDSGECRDDVHIASKTAEQKPENAPSAGTRGNDGARRDDAHIASTTHAQQPETAPQPQPAPQPEPERECTVEDVRAAIDRTYQRIDGGKPGTELYNRWHAALNRWFRETARLIGADKPTQLPDSASRLKFVEACDRLTVENGELTEKSPF